MGLFDIFTGAPGRRAAAENTARLGALKSEGLGYLDTGLAHSTGALDTAAIPLNALGSKYGAATSLGLDSLGVNGQAGYDRAMGAYQPSPGLDYATNAAVDANDRRMASRGMLGSGNNINATGEIAGKLAYNDFGNWRNSLLGLTGVEAGAASGLASLGSQRAGLYQTDAGQRVGLASNVVNGQNSQTTQAANAQIAANGNLWGAGMQLASLAAGGLGGGGFGGGGMSMNSSLGNGAGGYAYPVFR